MECDGNSQRVRAKKEQVTNTEGVDVKCVIGIDGKDDAFVLSVVVLLLVMFVCDGSVLDFLDFLRNGFQLLDFLDFLEVDVVDAVVEAVDDVAVEDVLLFFVSPSLSVVVLLLLLLLLSLPNNFLPQLDTVAHNPLPPFVLLLLWLVVLPLSNAGSNPTTPIELRSGITLGKFQ